jgi:hypothetical protein
LLGAALSEPPPPHAETITNMVTARNEVRAHEIIVAILGGLVFLRLDDFELIGRKVS